MSPHFLQLLVIAEGNPENMEQKSERTEKDQKIRAKSVCSVAFCKKGRRHQSLAQ